MADDRCIIDPQRDCLGISKANEVAQDLKALENSLNEFRRSTADTHSRFGERIGKLETRDGVRDEQFKQFKEKLEEMSRDMNESRRENKSNIYELRAEHKESMVELRKGNKDILEALTPLKHKVENLEHLSDDVDALKEKPAKRWENIIWEIIKYGLILLLGLAAAKIGFT